MCLKNAVEVSFKSARNFLSMFARKCQVMPENVSTLRIYTYTHIHIYTYTHIHIHIRVYTYTHVHIHIHMTYICACTYIYMYLHTKIHAHQHVHRHTYIPPYAHMRIHTGTHIHACVQACILYAHCVCVLGYVLKTMNKSIRRLSRNTFSRVHLYTALHQHT